MIFGACSFLSLWSHCLTGNERAGQECAFQSPSRRSRNRTGVNSPLLAAGGLTWCIPVASPVSARPARGGRRGLVATPASARGEARRPEGRETSRRRVKPPPQLMMCVCLLSVSAWANLGRYAPRSDRGVRHGGRLWRCPSGTTDERRAGGAGGESRQRGREGEARCCPSIPLP